MNLRTSLTKLRDSTRLFATKSFRHLLPDLSGLVGVLEEASMTTHTGVDFDLGLWTILYGIQCCTGLLMNLLGEVLQELDMPFNFQHCWFNMQTALSMLGERNFSSLPLRGSVPRISCLL
jgi:hypothetical protein